MSPPLARAVALTSGLALLAAIPTELVASAPFLCPWRIWFHVDCLGCGMTRALSSALHGNFSAALELNRGVLIVLPAMLAAAIRDLSAICCRDAFEDQEA